MIQHIDDSINQKVADTDRTIVNPVDDSQPLTNRNISQKTDLDKDSQEYLEPDFKTKLQGNNNYFEKSKPTTEYYMELYEGACLTRLKSTVIDPLDNHTDSEWGGGIKTNITTFTHKSRLNLIDQLSMINQKRIPATSVWFLTLTLDGGISKNYECKKYLNNFLTQMRSKYEGKKWFYCWKLEFQKRGVAHFHICLFGLKRVHHYWIRKTWSRITIGKKDFDRVYGSSKNKSEVFKKLVMTDLQRSKGWGETQQYFSKTLGYVSKCDDEQKVLIKKYNSFRPIGRFWGIGNKDIYKSFIDRRTVKMTKVEFYKLRRTFIKCLKSRWLKKHGDNFDWNMWKKYKRYLDSGITDKNPNTQSRTFRLFTPLPEIRLFTNNDILERLLSCLFPYKKNIFDSDTTADGKEQWKSSKYIIKVKVEIEILEQTG